MVDVAPAPGDARRGQAVQASPTVWRRWLASELQRLRAAAGLEQKQVAKALRCTVTKVSYFENAQRPVVPRDLDEVLLPLYGVPEERWPEYLDAAHKAREKGWWEYHDEDVLPEWFSRFVGLEQGASDLRIYQPQYVPGMLQTPDYASTITRSASTAITEDQVAEKVAVRRRRQAALTRATDPLRLWVVLDEAALRRLPGDEEVAREQIDHLCEMVVRSNVAVHVLPFSAGVHSYSPTPFILLSFPFRSDEGIVYLEHREGALYLEEVQEVESFRLAFEDLVRMSLPSEDAVDVIRNVAEASQS